MQSVSRWVITPSLSAHPAPPTIAAMPPTNLRLTGPARHAGLLAVLACATAFAAEPSARRATSASFDHDPRGSVQYLASDDLEGRGLGTKGLDKAAEYIADNFKKIGLKPAPGLDGYFQPFKMATSVRPGAKTALTFSGGEVNDDAGSDQPGYEIYREYVPLSFSAEKTFDAPVVFVGYAIKSDERNYDDFEGVDLQGKVALAMRYEPHDNQGNSRFTGGDTWSSAATLAKKADAAAAAGAVALILVNPPAFHEDDDPLVPFANQYRGDRADIPVYQVKRTLVDAWLTAAGAGKDLRTLQKQIDDAGKPASFALPDAARLAGNVDVEREERDVKNVVAVLPGDGNLAHEYVVVGAHYDHLGRGGPGSMNPGAREIHNGADDNASGTAAMLELAERFAKTGSRGRSVIFAAFTAEEVGLVGSQHFVTHPPVPLPRVAFMVNLDMVGRIRNDILYVGGHGTAEALDKVIADADEKSPLRFKSFGKGGFGPSDHMSFAMKKVPVLFLHSGTHRDYHRPDDDADKVNYKGLEQAVGFAADVVEDLVQLPKQQYVDAADANSMFNGPAAGPSSASGSGGLRVSLGVVPDYAPDDGVKGLRISGTTPGSPAAAAGLKEGDVIVQINDDKIGSIHDLTDVLRKGKPGEKVKIAVTRGGKRVDVDVTLTARRETPQTGDAHGVPPGHPPIDPPSKAPSESPHPTKD